MLEAVLLNERKMPPPLLQLGTELKSLTARDACLIPGRGAKIPHASWPKIQKNIKQKQYCNKFNKDFKNGPHQNKKKILKKKV